MLGDSANEVVWLSDAAAHDGRRVGAKAARLAMLKAAGFDVPNGFCVPPVLLANVDCGARSGAAVPAAISNACNQLDEPWAVRSSANVEDGARASFAGQFCTILGVRGSQLLDALCAVRASRESAMVSQYARCRDIDVGQIAMSALVQTIVYPDQSGVAFGRHPVSGADVVVIEACRGLPDVLVDGSITPDLIVVGRGGAVIQRQVGTKRTISEVVGGNIVRREASPAEQAALSVPDAVALTVAATVRAAERVFGEPQDVEWAMGDKLYVLQARPLTGRRPM